MSRALYITHKEIFPITGGDQVRFSQILSLLADHCEVDIISLAHTRHVATQSDFEPRLNEEHILYVPRFRRYLRAAHTLFNRRPEFINHYRDRRITDYVNDHAADYDVILCGSAAMAQYAPQGHRGLLLDMTDSLAMNYCNAAARNKGAKRAWLKSEATRMLRFERECRDTFRKVAYISPIDRDFAAYRPEVTTIVGNYVDIPPKGDCCTHAAHSRDISFIGRMDYAPNILAVGHFAELWQKGIDKVAGRFHIIGGYAPASVRSLADIKGISVNGFVPSLTPVFQNSALIVAPMLSGSGIQNKILQALAHGCCVVTTPIGAEGLDTSSGAFVVAQPGESFKLAVESLMGDRDKRRVIGRRAREYAGENFSRAAISRQFDNFLN